VTAPLFSTPVAMPDMSTPCAYAGVGSRSAPPDVLALMTRIARRLAGCGHTLRTGAAPGADTAFEAGHREACGAERLDVYLPWAAFERETRTRRGWNGGVALIDPGEEAKAIASRVHPYWHGLKPWERALHARNSYQILGQRLSLDDASRFVLCWTPDGATSKTTRNTGGTGQAVRLAARLGVPVQNLKRDDHRRAWERWLDAA
jgi:hypothetical protein